MVKIELYFLNFELCYDYKLLFGIIMSMCLKDFFLRLNIYIIEFGIHGAHCVFIFTHITYLNTKVLVCICDSMCMNITYVMPNFFNKRLCLCVFMFP